MYQSLIQFLVDFSGESPFLWALLVMAITALAGLSLYGFWEIVLRGIGITLGGGNRGNRDNGIGHGER